MGLKYNKYFLCFRSRSRWVHKFRSQLQWCL